MGRTIAVNLTRMQEIVTRSILLVMYVNYYGMNVSAYLETLGMLVGIGFKDPEMVIAPMAGPNPPITPMSISMSGFLQKRQPVTQTILEHAKARRENAVIGWRRILSKQECRIITPGNRLKLSQF